ncbi:MAG: phenylalanine--tRNA ligase subunit alpha, partial [Bacteroidales bacterium]|nr:phenylalanine--tRNA ligase subunit alpha [Bacteroidales bacterium]
MKERIQSLLEEIKGLSATHQEMVEKLRVKYLGKKGEIAVLFEEFRLLPPEEKREIGQLLNELKNA